MMVQGTPKASGTHYWARWDDNAFFRYLELHIEISIFDAHRRAIETLRWKYCFLMIMGENPLIQTDARTERFVPPVRESWDLKSMVL